MDLHNHPVIPLVHGYDACKKCVRNGPRERGDEDTVDGERCTSVVRVLSDRIQQNHKINKMHMSTSKCPNGHTFANILQDSSNKWEYCVNKYFLQNALCERSANCILRQAVFVALANKTSRFPQKRKKRMANRKKSAIWVSRSDRMKATTSRCAASLRDSTSTWMDASLMARCLSSDDVHFVQYHGIWQHKKTKKTVVVSACLEVSPKKKGRKKKKQHHQNVQCRNCGDFRRIFEDLVGRKDVSLAADTSNQTASDEGSVTSLLFLSEKSSRHFEESRGGRRVRGIGASSFCVSACIQSSSDLQEKRHMRNAMHTANAGPPTSVTTRHWTKWKEPDRQKVLHLKKASHLNHIAKDDQQTPAKCDVVVSRKQARMVGYRAAHLRLPPDTMLGSATFAQLFSEGSSRDLHLVVLTPGVLGLALAVALLGYALIPSAQQRAIRHIPQPATTLPILGNTLDFMRSADKLYDYFLDETLRQNGKMWRFKAVGRPVTVVLTSPEAFEDVLKTKFDDFAKGYVMWKNMEDLLGNGIFTVDGALWIHQRKTASHLFSLQMMRDSMEQTVIQYTAILCRRLEDIVRDKEVVNFKRLLDLFTMDVFTKIGFGVDLNGLESNENREFLNAFERASSNLLTRFTGPMWVWQLKKWLNVGSEKSMARDIKTLNTLIFDIISRSMANRSSNNNKKKKPSHAATASEDAVVGGGSRDLISLFLEKESTEYANGEQTQTDATLIRDMTLSFVAAGRDTTSQSMSWFILMLNRHPEVLAKIRQELEEKLPGLMNGGLVVPSMEDVQQLTYLDAALKESLRLNPVVALNSRVAVRDTTLHDGTFIKEGTKVSLPHYATARLKSVWGDDATEYSPERWLDADTGKAVQVSPYKFTAFLGGPRVCLGMKFAMMEMKVAMAAVLSKFDVKTVKDPFAFTYRPTLTMTINGPVDVVVTPRAAAAPTSYATAK